MKYTEKAFQLASAQVVAYANTMDKAVADGFAVRQAFVQQCLAGIQSNQLTLEQIEERIVSDFILALPVDEQDAARDTDDKSNRYAVRGLNNCGPFDADANRRVGGTIKQVYSWTKRIVSAGDSHVDRVIAGQSYIKVGKDTKPVQKQGNRTATPAAVQLPAASDCIKGLSAHLDVALEDDNIAMALASNSGLADIIAKIAALDVKVTAIVARKAA